VFVALNADTSAADKLTKGAPMIPWDRNG
jgi:hypothetical protein